MTTPAPTPKTNYLPWIILGCVLFFQFKRPTSPAEPASVTVDANIKAIADKVTPEQANRLAAFHGALADVLQRSEGLSNSQLRAWLGASDALYIRGTDLQGSFPGFTTERNRVFEAALGLEDVALDKAKAVEAAKLIEASLRR